MFHGSSLTTAEILAVFAEEAAAQGGSVTDNFDDGRRLFARSVMPRAEQVRPGDRLQGGVALKAGEEGVCLYPYIFRLVCSNGAIIAETLDSHALTGFNLMDEDAATQAIREGIQACCRPEAFTDNVRRMRSGADTEADLALNLLPFLAHPSMRGHVAFAAQIMDRFFGEGDRSRFGLANAITSLARDTSDPDARWDLERLGGAVAVGIVPPHPASGGRRGEARPRQLVAAQ